MALRRAFAYGITIFTALQLALARPASADAPPLDLDSARALFKEAVTDEDQFKRYEDALAKFRRVQEFKDSVNVRYRIGTCLEQLGRWAEALAAYEGAIALGAQEPSSDVFKASQERAAALEQKVAKVQLVLSAHAPSDAEVRVDDAKVAPQTMHDPIVLDPGHHTFSGTGSGAAPFRTSLTLPEGSHVTLTIALDPAPVAPKPLLPKPRPRPIENPPVEHASRVPGIVMVAGGGVLLAGGGVLALMQRAAVSDIKACTPNCPLSQKDQLDADASRAKLFYPLSIGLAAGGAVLAGIGLYFVLKPDPAPPPPSPAAFAPRSIGVAPLWTASGAGLSLRGDF